MAKQEIYSILKFTKRYSMTHPLMSQHLLQPKFCSLDINLRNVFSVRLELE